MRSSFFFSSSSSSSSFFLFYLSDPGYVASRDVRPTGRVRAASSKQALVLTALAALAFYFIALTALALATLAALITFAFPSLSPTWRRADVAVDTSLEKLPRPLAIDCDPTGTSQHGLNDPTPWRSREARASALALK